ncbi:Glutamate receptor ionotropic, kainate 1 [Amphibalanus amphitrite]|uniref:Glutamate receptor ionotropic, kainate 1 n=1 Tax=Amphibalanus amphitrite TaxID=1232801 RepID=A0A6A4V775_AMPAM|nr:Glutamate receptor ionotropic, kainate 1 [Amphibalanus amphitrite]
MTRYRDTVIVLDCSGGFISGSGGDDAGGSGLEVVHLQARSVRTICLNSPASRLLLLRQPEVRGSACVFWLPETAWSSPQLTQPQRLLSRRGVHCDRLAVIESEKNVSASHSLRLLDVRRADSVTAVMVGEGGGVTRVFVHHVDCVTETAQPTELLRSEVADPTSDLFFENVISLHGHHLRVVTTAAAGTLFVKFTGTGDEVEGVELNMLDAMSAALGFTFSLQHPRTTDGLFGTKLANGSWTGVVRAILDGRADLAIGDISTTLLRSTVVDYTYAFHMEPNCMALERPRRLPRWLVIAQPFDKLTWLLLLLSVVAAASALAAAPGLLPRRWSRRRRLQHALWFTANTLTSQSLFLPAKRPVHRAVLALWWLLCLVVSICYRTVLTSTLTVPHHEKPIDTLRALAESTLSVKVADGTAVQLFFRSYAGSDSYLARIVPRLGQFPIELLSNPDAPLSTDTVYVNELTVLRKFLMDRQDRRFYISRARFFQTGLAWPIRKGACYRPLLNRATHRLLQSGVVHHWMPRLVEEPSVRATQSLTVVDLSAAFLVLCSGLMAAALTLAVERCLGPRRGDGEAGGEPGKAATGRWVVPGSVRRPI